MNVWTKKYFGPQSRGGILICGALWLSLVGTGLYFLWGYENSPGKPAAAPATWPADSIINPTPGLATLVLLAHPKCPCTRATIGELALIMARCRGTFLAHVLFVKPEGTPDDWEKTDLWNSAADIPDVTVSRDEGGRESSRFGAVTSGQVLLYDRSGRLVFSGGITGARGHSGDNSGRSAIVSLLSSGKADNWQPPVFGCSLGKVECSPVAISPANNDGTHR